MVELICGKSVVFFNVKNCGLGCGLFRNIFSVVLCSCLVFSVFSKVVLLMIELWVILMMMLFGFSVLIILVDMMLVVFGLFMMVIIRLLMVWVKVMGLLCYV